MVASCPAGGPPGSGGDHTPLIIDGNNLFGSRPDGWWRDRGAAAGRLVTELGELHRRTGQQLTVVFDGRPDRRVAELGQQLGVVVHAARGGRDAADNAIVTIVAALPDPSAVAVVTSDRQLAQRLADRGVETITSGRFRRRLDQLAADELAADELDAGSPRPR